MLVLVAAIGSFEAGTTMADDPRLAQDTPPVAETREMMPCGPATLAVAFRLLDVPIDNYELDKLCDANGAANFLKMCAYARSKGLHADVATLSPKSLVELDRVAVLHLRPPNAPPGGDALDHFVVFMGSDSTGRWQMVDPVGVTPFSGSIDAEPLVRSWSGRALILSDHPLPWPLERGWWLRRWGIAALWWVIAPLVCMTAVFGLLRWKARTRRPVATAATIVVVGMCLMSCSEACEPEARVVARQTPVAEPLRQCIIANFEKAEHVFTLLDRLDLSTDDPPSILLHGLLGHGKDFALRNGDETISCLAWLLHGASLRSRSQPLIRVTDIGPKFQDTSIGAEACEAHFGQALFYLSETDIDPNSTTVQIDGYTDAEPLLLLVNALRNNVHEYADLSFCLPVILRWSKEDRWQCRFGSEWTLSRLLSAHLNAEERSVVCGGGHWRYALAFAVKGDHGRTLDRLVVNEAASRLDEILNATLAGIDADGKIPDGVIPVPDTMRFSHQVHSLEWLMVAVSDETMRTHSQLHEAVSWAIREMTERWATLSPRDLCHGAHALRLYRRRINEMGD